MSHYAEALRAQLETTVQVPDGGLVAEVDYVTVVRVRILDEQGNQHVVYTQLNSRSLDPCTEEGLLRRALRSAEDRNC